MYEGLVMKNEFENALYNYTICVFQKMDPNRVRDLFQKFNLLEGINKDGQFLINKAETF